MKINNYKYLVIIFYFFGIISCGNNKTNEKNFAISDSSVISKIIMTDKSGNSVLLKNDNNNWSVNNKFDAWNNQVDYTLKVMEDIRIKSSVAEDKIDYVIKNIATSGVKIELFQKNKKIKSYYIGGNTKDYFGTYMMIEGSTTPYIMHIPDRNPGILNPKFKILGTKVNENVWRAPIVIDYKENPITKIVSNDLINTDQSFVVDLKNLNLYDCNLEKIKIDTSLFSYWKIAFTDLHCGPYKPELKKNNFELIKKIYITTKNTTDSLYIYDKTKFQNSLKEFNSSVEYMYASFNDSELVVIQNNIFNKVLISIEEFLKFYN
tara:strand:- start:500 stop:1459 length:960 start_codon:yes stop_codon:yes gene_type:complete